ncbi:hypothetical protein Tcan_14513 [Toxocara canis]|uniref:Uncharacterized protein n=1 Tax=Toxocara canis TaxID=6265 RepID=A0A0B2V9T2_TOXCA|nr:hypothetical protein Tcan_14513 [Toxocara canis]
MNITALKVGKTLASLEIALPVQGDEDADKRLPNAIPAIVRRKGVVKRARSFYSSVLTADLRLGFAFGAASYAGRGHKCRTAVFILLNIMP